MKEDRRKGHSGRRPYSNNIPYSRKNLVQARLERHLSHRQIAEYAGCSRSSYTKIESGIAKGSNIFWHKMEELFNLPEDYLKGGEK